VGRHNLRNFITFLFYTSLGSAYAFVMSSAVLVAAWPQAGSRLANLSDSTFGWVDWATSAVVRAPGAAAGACCSWLVLRAPAAWRRMGVPGAGAAPASHQHQHPAALRTTLAVRGPGRPVRAAGCALSGG
jgi:hypothetical protein